MGSGNLKYFKKQNMQIKQLERATKILQSIKELDAEIVRVEAFAMQAANDDIELKLRLDIVDLKKKAEEDNKVKFDEDGSLDTSRYLIPRLMFSYGGVVTADEKKDKSSKTEYSRDISNSSALQILGVLLFELQNKRMQLIRKLEAIGVAL